MTEAKLIGALGTPLDDDECLHEAGLEKHLDEQWSMRVGGVLVAGTMGVMQLLRDATYLRLVRRSIELSRGRGQVYIGAGDTSLARTRDRIVCLNEYTCDGVFVITPYFLKFGQAELIDYYRSLADLSSNPLYIYDAPARTGTKLEFETVERLAEHPNIFGIKCTCDVEWTRELLTRVDGQFRVIPSALSDVHLLLREGIMQHLDGLFALMPHWTAAISRAAEAKDWSRVDEYKNRFVGLFELVRRFGSFASYTAIVNARGIPGNFAPAPLRPLSEIDRDTLLRDSLFHEESPPLLRGPHAIDKYSRQRSSR
jgi:4-hydroxy-tetrahydrodipicolinate synthase